MRRGRVLIVTAGLVAAGAIGGAVSGAAAITIALLAYLHALPPVGRLGIAAAIAAAIGAALGVAVWPALAWGLLRRVPLGRAAVATSVGATLGGAVGLLVGASAVNPYVPFSVHRAPVPQGALGAIAGVLIAAVWLRLSQRRHAGIGTGAG
jgi:hypothetical protein